MNYTIKTLADELSVSKQAVSDKIKKLGLQSDLAKDGNHFVINENQANLIKSAFQKTRQDQPQSKFAKENSDLLYDIVKTLQAQLEIKDKQIADLQKANDDLREMAAQSQALHAGTIQTQLLSEKSEQTAEPKKRHWWQRKKVKEDE